MCIVSDVRMPGLSGLELLEELKRRKYGIPVIFITAHGDPATRAHVERLVPGAPVLAKPVSADRLRQAVVTALAPRVD